MINYEDLKAINAEELNALIRMAENELRKRKETKLKEVKTKTAIAIRELIKVCEELNIHFLGDIYLECCECDEGSYFDILEKDVLEEVAEVLEGK